MGLKICADASIGSLFGCLVPLGSVESLTIAIVSGVCGGLFIRALYLLILVR